MLYYLSEVKHGESFSSTLSKVFQYIGQVILQRKKNKKTSYTIWSVPVNLLYKVQWCGGFFYRKAFFLYKLLVLL